MKLITDWKTDEVYQATNDKGVQVTMDMSDVEKKEGQSPVELLLSAVSGCVAVDVIIMLKKKRKEIKDFKIEATGDRKDTFPRGFKQIYLKFMLQSPNTKEEELHKVIQLAIDKYCSVADSLTAPIEVSVEISE